MIEMLWDIKYLDKPSCSTNQKKIYGVSERETAHISCKVNTILFKVNNIPCKVNNIS